MAIVQISKIIHRSGANVDLPQLDTGEIGFSTDTRQVFIGNDPLLYPPASITDTTQTEILTEASTIDFSRLANSSNVTMKLTSVGGNQILGISSINSVLTVVNKGGSVGGIIDLGDASNLKIAGAPFNGAVLTSDGTGNLTWSTNGTLRYDIANISQANPAVVTTQQDHLLGTGTSVTIYGIYNGTAGMLQLETAGTGSTNRFYVRRLTNRTFSLYTDSAVLNGVNSSLFDPAVANLGYVLGQINPTGNATAGGANTQLQFNDAGGFLGTSNLTFNKTTNNLSVTGNVIISTGRLYGNVTGNVTGAVNGTIGATTPNTGAFTIITASSTITATGNITGGNLVTTGRLTAGNLTLSSNATVSGNLSVTANITTNNITASQSLLSYGSNAWSMFANSTGIFVTDSLSGNTYQVNLTQV